MCLDDLQELHQRGGSVVDLLDLLAMENEDCDVKWEKIVRNQMEVQKKRQTSS